MTGNEIRQQLASYVLREVPLESFEDWFVSESWNVQNSSDTDTVALVYAIEALLAEYSGAYINEDVLRKRLAEMVEQYTVSIQIGHPEVSTHVQTGSSQSANSVSETWQIRAVDIQPSLVRA
jgi:hypothetical protein